MTLAKRHSLFFAMAGAVAWIATGFPVLMRPQERSTFAGNSPQSWIGIAAFVVFGAVLAIRLGLQNALRAVLRSTGGLEHDIDLSKVFAIADAAVDVPVLSELYAKMKDSPWAPDLPALWQSLGVEATADGVRFNNAAPLASIRRRILQLRTIAAAI